MSVWKLCWRLPLGPVTETVEPSSATSTPEGISMGCLPILDMPRVLL